MLSKIYNLIFKKTYIEFLEQLKVVNESENLLSLFIINEDSFYIMNIYNNLGSIIKKNKGNKKIVVEHVEFSINTIITDEIMNLISESKTLGNIITPFNYVEYHANIVSKLKNMNKISSKEGLFILKSIFPPKEFFINIGIPKIENEKYIWVD